MAFVKELELTVHVRELMTASLANTVTQEFAQTIRSLMNFAHINMNAEEELLVFSIIQKAILEYASHILVFPLGI